MSAGVLDPWFIAYPPKGRARDVDGFHALKDFWPALLALVAALKFWLDARTARRAELGAKLAADEAKAVQRTDLIKIAHDVAGELIAELRTEADRLRKRVADLDAEFATFRKVHDKMVADKDAELALLRGRVKSLEATLDAYERLLTHNNIPHAKPAEHFIALRGGEAEIVPLVPDRVEVVRQPDTPAT